MRKLATIRTISDITPIANADKIEVAHVDGWQVVVKKDEFKVGDKVVYVEIDSKMPEKPEYSFLESRKYVVKTIKLRGQISQGLILPLSVLPDGKYNEGKDVTNILGITKYDPEAEVENSVVGRNQKKQNGFLSFMLKSKYFRRIYFKIFKKKKVSGKFPEWIHKTDEERIQNLTKLFEFLKENKIALSQTEKIDGTSATYFLRRTNDKKKKRPKYEFGVCSRNLRLTTEDDSYYWKVARKYNIENVLKELISGYDYIILQGEITGDGIQKNKYPAKGGERFWAFNLIYPDDVKITTDGMKNILEKFGISTVPIIGEFTIPDGWEISDLVKHVEGKSVVNPQIEREGIVFRNVANNVSFKCINNKFLIKNDL